MRSINDIVVTGEGLLITFDDNVKKQFVWRYKNGQLILTEGTNPIDNSLIDEILNIYGKDSRSVTLWNHLLSPNTWTPMIFDEIIVEGRDNTTNLRIEGSIITLPSGEWKIDTDVMIHRAGASGSDGVVLSLRAWDASLGQELDYSFRQSTSPALANAPLSLSTTFIVDNSQDSGLDKYVIVEIQSDSNKCTLGAESGKVPVGSINHAGHITITRIG